MNSKLNYDFAIRDYDATKSKHTAQITKVKKAVKYQDVIDSDFEQVVVGEVQNKLYFLSQMGIKYDFTKQKDLKQVKSLVNSYTRTVIGNTLEYLELPRSWDTAFYIVYYKKINNLMKRFVKEDL